MIKYYLKNSVYPIIIIFCNVLILLIILEIGARGYSLLVKKNLCAKNLNIKKYESEYHSDIGYEPMPGKKNGCYGEKYSINEKRYRDYPNFDENKSDTLIVGDSFGFGDEVSDNETISYYLNKNYQIATINAAVYGYGLDQALLRAKLLSNQHKIKNILLIISSGGYTRTNVIERNGITKPYFLKDGYNIKLIKPEKKNFKYSSRSRIIEKSLLLNYISKRLNIPLVVKEKVNQNDPVDMGCRIIYHFNKYFDEKKIRFKVILYRDASEIIHENLYALKRSKKFLNCLEEKKITYLDTLEILKRNKNNRKKLYIKETFGHPTNYSNNLISDFIASNFG